MSHRSSGKRFHDDMLKPKKRPRLSLPVLVAARDYKKKIAAAVLARRELVAEVVKRTDGRVAALETLRLIAEEFGLSPFSDSDIDFLNMEG
ncbi:MAG: hypothetical protein ACJ8C4_07450 [Gemmataceae bacterium]